MQGEEHEVTHEVWRFQRAKEKGSFLFLLRLVIMSETSKHFRCLFSTEVTIQQMYKDIQPDLLSWIDIIS